EKAKAVPYPPIWEEVRPYGCQMGSCRIRLTGRVASGPDDLKKALDNDYQAFSYSVAPREAIQRIAALASARVNRQLAAGGQLKGLTGPLDTSVGMSTADERNLTTI